MFNIGIIGLGFMGGCIARTLTKSDKINKIFAYDINREELELAKKEQNITDKKRTIFYKSMPISIQRIFF